MQNWSLRDLSSSQVAIEIETPTQISLIDEASGEVSAKYNLTVLKWLVFLLLDRVHSCNWVSWCCVLPHLALVTGAPWWGCLSPTLLDTQGQAPGLTGPLPLVRGCLCLFLRVLPWWKGQKVPFIGHWGHLWGLHLQELIMPSGLSGQGFQLTFSWSTFSP